MLKGDQCNGKAMDQEYWGGGDVWVLVTENSVTWNKLGL